MAYAGDQCERKMTHITYKPLTERMLQEPFWLGLLTVFVVMGILGIIWCAKRHVPEKIEKILSEEAERSRHCKSERIFIKKFYRFVVVRHEIFLLSTTVSKFVLNEIKKKKKQICCDTNFTTKKNYLCIQICHCQDPNSDKRNVTGI